MKFEELEAQYRERVGDHADPPLADAPTVLRWLNEAVAEACIRGDLIREADAAELCEFSIAAESTTAVTLPAAMQRIDYASFTPTDSEPIALKVEVSRMELDRLSRTWRTDTGTPSRLLVEGRKMRIVVAPETAGVLRIEGWRIPLDDERMGARDSEPVIATLHHEKLVCWAVYRALSNPDGELFDQGKADRAYAEFQAYFGPRPDADADQAYDARPQFNKVWL